jgi:hypothetical protein
VFAGFQRMVEALANPFLGVGENRFQASSNA